MQDTEVCREIGCISVSGQESEDHYRMRGTPADCRPIRLVFELFLTSNFLPCEREYTLFKRSMLHLKYTYM